MGTKISEVGGGPATGLGNEWVQFLSGILNNNYGGQPGAGQRFSQANPVGQTQGISSVIQDLLAGGAGKVGGAMDTMLTRDTNRGAADLRARFGTSGGMSLGSPGAYAESLYRTEAAPRNTMAINQMQMSAILPLLQLLNSTANKGITQRQTIAQPDALSNIISGVSQVAGIGGNIASMFSGGMSGGKGPVGDKSGGTMIAPTLPVPGYSPDAMPQLDWASLMAMLNNNIAGGMRGGSSPSDYWR